MLDWRAGVFGTHTNGNHDKMAMAAKSRNPIMYSYALASSFIGSQNPITLNNGLQTCPILKEQNKMIHDLASTVVHLYVLPS